MSVPIDRQIADLEGAIEQINIYLDQHNCDYYYNGACEHDAAIDRRTDWEDALRELKLLQQEKQLIHANH